MLCPNLTIGLDLGDRFSRVCGIDLGGSEVLSDSIPTSPAGLQEYFGKMKRCRVIVEVGTHSPWVSRELAAGGHEVIVANPSAVYGKGRRRKRNDRLDAEYLARQGRADPKLLHPIHHRGERAQRDLELLRARDAIVGGRTRLINHVRGSVKSFGGRVTRCSAEAFSKRARTEIPQELQSALTPLLDLIQQLTDQIRAYDREVEKRVASDYPEARRVQQVKGVGPLTALAFVLLIEDPHRFTKSRDVGAYFGLCPRLDESSRSQPQLRISKAGDKMGRRLLVSAAQYILGPFGPECDLRRHGALIAERGGKNARKRAAVAVARKLAVMMHKLWVSGAPYDPHMLASRHAVTA
jgi:transposase